MVTFSTHNVILSEAKDLIASDAMRSFAPLRMTGLLQGGVIRRNEQRRMHFGQQRRTLGEIGLPLGILHRRGARLEALLQVLVAPQMDPLVGLRELTGPGAPD